MSEESIESPMQQDETTGEVVETPAQAQEAPIEPDADQLRDDKCIPIARAMLIDVSTDLIPADGSQEVDLNPVLVKFLTKALEADLNLTTENPYVIQLQLSILSALNVSVQGATTLPIDETRYARIERALLAIASEADIPLGMQAIEDKGRTLGEEALAKINALFAEEKLTFIEIKYVMDTIFNAFNGLQNAFVGSTELSLKKAEESLWGVKDISDVTMGMLDQKLKAMKTESTAT